ncbi:hypothetical protein H5410_012371 [Solanum commersonii]|uniref:Uncharacterized protein n=1 Tax=Solanum commersonii TaxID=4109 RepID=A0A9J6AS65_SOLCO|nr:hypothetical protein H5410_012371 [Solanum commersonii]
MRRFDRLKDPEWNDFEYRFISKKPSPTFELSKQELYRNICENTTTCRARICGPLGILQALAWDKTTFEREPYSIYMRYSLFKIAPSIASGLRAAAQSISYEIPLALCVLSISLRSSANEQEKGCDKKQGLSCSCCALASCLILLSKATFRARRSPFP